MLQAKMTDGQKQFHFSSKKCGLTQSLKSFPKFDQITKKFRFIKAAFYFILFFTSQSTIFSHVGTGLPGSIEPVLNRE